MDGAAKSTPLNIAVIDDDEAILDSFKLVLDHLGWRVQTYASGEAFLVDLINHKPDCVILDPHLPQMSGAEVARSLANNNAHFPIIGLTARPDSLLAKEVIDAGAHVMLTKPITVETLIEQIQAVISAEQVPLL